MWFIKEVDGVVFNVKEHELKTIEGDHIASVVVNSYELLEIWLGRDTNFSSDDGKIHAVGWNGCEEHMGRIMRLKQGGGTLEYQENRCSPSREPGKVIKIKIVMLRGNIVPAKEPKQPHWGLGRIVDSIRVALS